MRIACALMKYNISLCALRLSFDNTNPKGGG
jgi:hypothetical protein